MTYSTFCRRTVNSEREALCRLHRTITGTTTRPWCVQLSMSLFAKVYNLRLSRCSFIHKTQVEWLLLCSRSNWHQHCSPCFNSYSVQEVKGKFLNKRGKTGKHHHNAEPCMSASQRSFICFRVFHSRMYEWVFERYIEHIVPLALCMIPS